MSTRLTCIDACTNNAYMLTNNASTKIYRCIPLFIYTYIYAYIYIHAYTHIHTHAIIHTRNHASLQIYRCPRRHLTEMQHSIEYVRASDKTHEYICMHRQCLRKNIHDAFIHAYVHMHMYIHTYTHTPPDKSLRPPAQERTNRTLAVHERRNGSIPFFFPSNGVQNQWY